MPSLLEFSLILINPSKEEGGDGEGNGIWSDSILRKV